MRVHRNDGLLRCSIQHDHVDHLLGKGRILHRDRMLVIRLLLEKLLLELLLLKLLLLLLQLLLLLKLQLFLLLPLLFLLLALLLLLERGRELVGAHVIRGHLIGHIGHLVAGQIESRKIAADGRACILRCHRRNGILLQVHAHLKRYKNEAKGFPKKRLSNLIHRIGLGQHGLVLHLIDARRKIGSGRQHIGTWTAHVLLAHRVER